MRNLKRALSLGLTAAMISGLMVMGSSAASSNYTDVADTDNVEAIEVLKAVGIMVGDESGDFNPDQKVTRNEMAVVMSNLMAYNVATYANTSPFTDVPSWAEPYVAACWTCRWRTSWAPASPSLMYPSGPTALWPPAMPTASPAASAPPSTAPTTLSLPPRPL